MGKIKRIYYDIKFKMKVVNDKLHYIDESDKKKGYNLKDGKNIYKTGLVDEVNAKAVGYGQKKAMKKSLGIRENSYSLFHSSQLGWSAFKQ